MDYINNYVMEIKTTIDKLPTDMVKEAVEILNDARINHRQIFIMGNGGSASTASHFVCDLSKNTRSTGWPNFRVIGLSDNHAIISAYANDEGYETVFAQQMASLLHPGDVVIAISASGNSANVIRAVDLARKMGATTIGFTGFDGGLLGPMVDLNIHINSRSIEQVEDLHLMIEHMITKALREMTKVDQPFDSRAKTPNWIETIQQTVNHSLSAPAVTIDCEPLENLSVQDLLRSVVQNVEVEGNSQDTIRKLLPITLQSVGARSGSIVVLDERGQAVEGVLANGSEVKIETAQMFADIVHDGLVGWVIENRVSALVENTLNDPRWLSREWEYSDEGSKSAISVPLTSNDQVVGVITVVNPYKKPFTTEHVAVLTAIAVTISVSRIRIHPNHQ